MALLDLLGRRWCLRIMWELQRTPMTFRSLQAACGDISPTIVAGGIKVALLTTVFGLIVAIILQLFYNYLVAKIDSIVNDMEDSSISFIDILSKYKK